MTIIIILIILIGLFIFVVVNSGKEENDVKQDVSLPTTSELLLRSELRIQETKKLLNDIEDENINRKLSFQDEVEFEVVGVHVENRKKYILNNCSEYDFVEVFNERNNPYSEKAIAISHNNKIIGYISEFENNEARDLIENEFEAFISEIDYDGSYLMVKIVINY